jgi:transposase InsO family protein
LDPGALELEGEWHGTSGYPPEFRRKVLDLIDAAPTAVLVINALAMAIQARSPSAGAIIHSNQGGDQQPRSGHMRRRRTVRTARSDRRRWSMLKLLE